MRKLSLCIIFLLYVPSVQAENIDYLNVGEGVYVEGFFSDELVYITAIDKATNRVRVRRADDSVVEWVHASRLITEDAARENAMQRGEVAAGLIIAAINEFSGQSRNDSWRNRPNCFEEYTAECDEFIHDGTATNVFQELGADRLEDTGRFRLWNNCRHPIRLALRYRETDGDWTTIGWWEAAANTSEYLKISNDAYATTDAGFFFYYAEHLGREFYWGGDDNYRWDEMLLGMKEVEDESGDREVSLSCPDH